MQDLSVTFSWLGPNHTALIKATKKVEIEGEKFRAKLQV